MAISAKDFINKAVREIDIPGFEPGDIIQIKIKSMSLMGLVSSGKIPNTLLSGAGDLFKDADMLNNPNNVSKVAELNQNEIAEMAKIMDVVCKECMVEPKYVDVGEYLTDEQKMAIFESIQGGINQILPSNVE